MRFTKYVVQLKNDAFLCRRGWSHDLSKARTYSMMHHAQVTLDHNTHPDFFEGAVIRTISCKLGV